MSPPEVSVIIPTRDRRRILERTLGTALAQRGADFEIIVVDDGSADDTAEWVGGHPDPRVRLVRHASPQGVARARNAGIARAAGEWVAFLDDDDLWAPDKLERQLALARRSGASFVYAAAVRVDGDLHPRALLRSPDPSTLADELIESNVMPAGQASVMARRELVRAVGGFDERLSMLADWDMWLKLASRATGAASDDVLVAYVVHEDSMSMRSVAVSRRELRMLAETHRAAARDSGRRIGGDVFWHWMIWSNRRTGRRVATARVYAYRSVRFRRPSDLLRAAAALVGPPLMDFGPAWASRAEPGAPSPPWLDRLRERPREAGPPRPS